MPIVDGEDHQGEGGRLNPARYHPDHFEHHPKSSSMAIPTKPKTIAVAPPRAGLLHACIMPGLRFSPSDGDDDNNISNSKAP
jgi:hypothetical protein